MSQGRASRALLIRAAKARTRVLGGSLLFSVKMETS
jgi:hypothetical protein